VAVGVLTRQQAAGSRRQAAGGRQRDNCLLLRIASAGAALRNVCDMQTLQPCIQVLAAVSRDVCDSGAPAVPATWQRVHLGGMTDLPHLHESSSGKPAGRERAWSGMSTAPYSHNPSVAASRRQPA